MSIESYINSALMDMRCRPDVRRAITYVSPKITVKVTRQRRYRTNAKQQTYLVSIGSPNFLERRMLKSGKISKYPLRKYEQFAS